MNAESYLPQKRTNYVPVVELAEDEKVQEEHAELQINPNNVSSASNINNGHTLVSKRIKENTSNIKLKSG